MSKESLLKKEFKHSDVQRVRNLVNKDFNSKTKLQSGYKKSFNTIKKETFGKKGVNSGLLKMVLNRILLS